LFIARLFVLIRQGLRGGSGLNARLERLEKRLELMSPIR
jgi:hypothetical protein